MPSTRFTFDQIQLAKNENLTNSVINRALHRLYAIINDIINSGLYIPSTNALEITYLADIPNVETGQHERRWVSSTELFNNMQKPKLTELNDVTNVLPGNGQTPTWNQATNNFTFQKLPKKITDLKKFEEVVDLPLDGMVMTWNDQLNSWVAQTVPKYIGVGYIYHKICSRPTVIQLPVSNAALSGGEQVVITKILPPDLPAGQRVPILIVAPEGSNTTIVGHRSLLCNTHTEDWASIHLRAVLNTDGQYIWVPVGGTGTWKPSDLTDLTADYTSLAIDRPPALTENQIKIQPYNINIEFSSGINDITGLFKAKLTRTTPADDWVLDTAQSTAGVYYSADSGYFTITHSVMLGVRPVRTTVFLHSNNKVAQITPNEVYFEANSYSSIFVNLDEYMLDNTLTEIEFDFSIGI